MDTTQNIARSAARFLSGTLVSRLSGLLRDMLMAAAFGSSAAIAAFFVAFRIVNLPRRLLGEGALHTAFIPQFEQLRSLDPLRAGRFARDLHALLCLVLLLLMALTAGGLLAVLQWAGLDEGNRQIVWLTILMVPALGFVCLYGFNCALLNMEKIYFIPAMAPTLCNLVWIAFVLLLWGMDAQSAMVYLSLAMVAAFALQWIMTVPKVMTVLRGQLNQDLWAHLKLWSQDLRQFITPFCLAVLGVGAVQINTAFDAAFARAAEVSGPAYLWYAIRIQQVPLAFFGVALSVSLLPPLSRALKGGDKAHFSHLLNYGVRQTILLMIPATGALVAVGSGAVSLIYGRGQFLPLDVEKTYHCLAAYAMGLLPMTITLVQSQACFAHQNYRSPALASSVAVVVNIFLNGLFIFGFGWTAVSVAIATSLSALVQMGYLWRTLVRLNLVKLNQAEPLYSTGSLFVRTLLATLVATAATFGLRGVLSQGVDFFPLYLQPLVLCAGQCLLFLGSFAVGVYALRIHQEFLTLLKLR